MIVSRKQAEEAIKVLGIGHTTDDVTAAAVRTAYILVAKVTHPDMPGGDAAKFAEADRAKHVLERWLARPADDRPKGLRATACGNCAGTGRIKVQHGFKHMLVLCQPCNGTGDADLDKEKYDARG